nr:hypothetical protein [Acidianus infernus]
MSFPLRIDKEDSIKIINDKFYELENRVKSILANEGFSNIIIVRYAEMRYYGQEHTVKVPIMGGIIRDIEIEEIKRRFNEVHKAIYSFTLDSPIEIVNFHVSGIAKLNKLPIIKINRENRQIDKAFKGMRKTYLGKFDEWPVYDKELLPLSYEVQGPAIIEDDTSTAIILDDQKGVLDEYGNLIITW